MSAIIFWCVAAIVLASAEALSGEFFLLMLAGGAFGAATASVFTGNILVQVVVFAIVSIVLITGVRPAVRRHLMSFPDLPSITTALAGSSALVLTDVSSTDGLVKTDGEEWSARSLDPAITLERGEEVVIVSVEGPVLIVDSRKPDL